MASFSQCNEATFLSLGATTKENIRKLRHFSGKHLPVVGERNRDRFWAFERLTRAAESSEVFADNAFKNSGFDHSIGSVLNFHKSTADQFREINS